MKPAGSQSGFTLVEMLVAILLFGIIATAAATLTTSATRSFVATDMALASVSSLEQVRAALSADLGQAVRRTSLSADGKRMSAFTLMPEGFVLVRGGVSGVLPHVQKVAWGFDGHALLRQTFPAIDKAEPGEAVVLMEGIRSVQLRVAGDKGWQTQWTPARPEDLPRALEVNLVRQDGRLITMKFLVGT